MPGETIPSAVMASIALRPDAEAVVEPGRRVTYRELGELVSASTRAMLAAGVEPGDRVAIWAPNGLGWIVAALGAQSAGAALVPINTRWKGDEAAYVLSASKAVVLVTTVGFLGVDRVAMLRAVETPLPHLRQIVLLDGPASPPVTIAPGEVKDGVGERVVLGLPSQQTLEEGSVASLSRLNRSESRTGSPGRHQ